MAFNERFLAELKARNNIADVISASVQLKRNGTRHVGLCPFHGEKTPSFTVFEETSSFYCFGCGAGGDVISFVMRYNNLDYVEAVKLLAERCGMELPEQEARFDAYAKNRRSRMLEMHKLAARFYYDTLMSPAGAEGLAYFRDKRGLTPETIRHFGLGYAPDSFGALRDHLKQKGYGEKEMVAAGLLSQKNNSCYDKFRNRVMFPVFDIRGNVVAFSGRVLDDAKPKYLNTPDTDIYTKGQIVFGLQYAKNEPEGLLILCEGNIDVVSMHQAGFTGAVAPLGTAFTPEQARILARYAKRVVVAFDNDSAGLKATEKAIRFLEENGIPVRVLQMQGAKDPDEFIKTYGKERFALLLKSSQTPMEFRLAQLRAGLDLRDTAMRVEYLKNAESLIAGISGASERDVYIQQLSGEVKIPPDALRTDIERLHKRRAAGAVKKEIRTEEQALQGGGYDAVNPERAGAMRAAKAEEALIALLVRHPDLWKEARETVPPALFITEFNRRVYTELMRQAAETPEAQTPVLTEAFNEMEQARIWYFINTQVFHGDPKLRFSECVNVLKKEGEKRVDTQGLSPEELMARLQARNN